MTQQVEIGTLIPSAAPDEKVVIHLWENYSKSQQYYSQTCFDVEVRARAEGGEERLLQQRDFAEFNAAARWAKQMQEKWGGSIEIDPEEMLMVPVSTYAMKALVLHARTGKGLRECEKLVANGDEKLQNRIGNELTNLLEVLG